MGCAAAALAGLPARAQERPVRAIPDSILVDGVLDAVQPGRIGIALPGSGAGAVPAG